MFYSSKFHCSKSEVCPTNMIDLVLVDILKS
jgi:hypothetical protein